MIQPRYTTKLSISEFFIVLGTGIVLSVPSLFFAFWILYKRDTDWWSTPVIIILGCIAFIGAYLVKISLSALRDDMVKI